MSGAQIHETSPNNYSGHPPGLSALCDLCVNSFFNFQLSTVNLLVSCPPPRGYFLST